MQEWGASGEILALEGDFLASFQKGTEGGVRESSFSLGSELQESSKGAIHLILKGKELMVRL